MKAEFWHQKWQTGQIGFHESTPNKLLTDHFQNLKLNENSSIFVPLCGKTNDIAWLLNQGYQVVGAELSKIAIDELFDNLKLQPNITQIGNLLHYQSNNLEVYVGNIFDIPKNALTSIDAIYDRAALVALPESIRKQYSQHLMLLCPTAKHLLIVFTYDQSQMQGPPFSIPESEILSLYQSNYQITMLHQQMLTTGRLAEIKAVESIWLLS